MKTLRSLKFVQERKTCYEMSSQGKSRETLWNLRGIRLRQAKGNLSPLPPGDFSSASQSRLNSLPQLIQSVKWKHCPPLDILGTWKVTRCSLVSSSLLREAKLCLLGWNFFKGKKNYPTYPKKNYPTYPILLQVYCSRRTHPQLLRGLWMPRYTTVC